MDRGDFLEKWKICKKDKWKLFALVLGIALLVSLAVFGQEEEGVKKKAKNAKKDTQAKVETELERPETIRVLLKNSDYSSIYHQEVAVTSDKALKVTQGESTTDVATGEAFCLNKAETAESVTVNATLGDGQGKIQLEGGKMSVSSITRSQGTPFYEGKLEIYATEQGYVLVNEVDFETYVKGVIPAEMPASYEVEALKAQAICARTYAVMKQKGEKSYGEYEADLDDSVQYQVYNNQLGSESTDKAVEETAGEILTYNGGIAATYYFSTSWGYTTGMDAWLKEPVPYLSTVTVGEAEDMTAFEEAFLSPEGTFYEEKEPWYRWQVSVDMEANKEELMSNLTEGQKDTPEDILVWKEEEQSYVSEAPAAFEQIRNIEVTGRGSGGVACTLEITTDKQKIQINGQHTIRKLLAFKSNQIVRQDGSVVKNFSLLPSGFFLLETEKEGENVKGLKICGGGFGHGVGMSQNGANQMAKLGKNYREILSFFYQGAEIGTLK